MSDERIDFDALAHDAEALDYHEEHDFAGNIIGVVYFEDKQRLDRLLAALPRLIELARVGQQVRDGKIAVQGIAGNKIVIDIDGV